jgi:hypothetical protein
MATLEVAYEGKDYLLDLDDLDLAQGRAMERFGVKNLKALEEGISEGDLGALTVAYWVMLQQNGEDGARLERVVFKPVKFIKALVAAGVKAAEDADPDPKGE